MSGRAGETALTAAQNLSPSFTKRPLSLHYDIDTDLPTSSKPSESFELQYSMFIVKILTSSGSLIVVPKLLGRCQM